MRSDVRSRTGEARDSVRVEQVMVAEHDTIMETTTITVRENEAGDTLRMSRVTERDRVRDRAHVKSMEVDVRVVRDTVYLERRDSCFVKNANLKNQTDKMSAVADSLKWVFWILICAIVLVFVFKVTRFINLKF
jgi:hypothetical protein